MPSKEKLQETVEKWDSLLEGLSKAKYKRYKYCRIYENIVKNNSHQDYKLLLSLAYRVFKIAGDVKISRSHNNAVDIVEFEDADLYDNGTIMIDSALAFLDAAAQMTAAKLEETESIAYLKAEKNGEMNVIRLYY